MSEKPTQDTLKAALKAKMEGHTNGFVKGYVFTNDGPGQSQKEKIVNVVAQQFEDLDMTPEQQAAIVDTTATELVARNHAPFTATDTADDFAKHVVAKAKDTDVLDKNKVEDKALREHLETACGDKKPLVAEMDKMIEHLTIDNSSSTPVRKAVDPDAVARTAAALAVVSQAAVPDFGAMQAETTRQNDDVPKKAQGDKAVQTALNVAIDATSYTQAVADVNKVLQAAKKTEIKDADRDVVIAGLEGKKYAQALTDEIGPEEIAVAANKYTDPALQYTFLRDAAAAVTGDRQAEIADVMANFQEAYEKANPTKDFQKDVKDVANKAEQTVGLAITVLDQEVQKSADESTQVSDAIATQKQSWGTARDAAMKPFARAEAVAKAQQVSIAKAQSDKQHDTQRRQTRQAESQTKADTAKLEGHVAKIQTHQTNYHIAMKYEGLSSAEKVDTSNPTVQAWEKATKPKSANEQLSYDAAMQSYANDFVAKRNVQEAGHDAMIGKLNQNAQKKLMQAIGSAIAADKDKPSPSINKNLITKHFKLS